MSEDLTISSTGEGEKSKDINPNNSNAKSDAGIDLNKPRNQNEPIEKMVITESADKKETSDKSQIQSSDQNTQSKKTVAKTETTTDKESDTMEVHHHSKEHHPKKLKDYLFEFLMLFLAVTAGFFMENQREHYVEHKREKQFARQLLTDLRMDSVLFERRESQYQSIQKGYDNLNYLLIQKNDATDKEVLEALLPVAYVFDILVTTTTYNQMKSSGALRYIRNWDLTANLQKYYDVLLPRAISLAENSRDYYFDNINPFYLTHFRIQDIDLYEDSLINKNPVILNRTRQTDQSLANIMGGYRSLLKIQAVTMNTPALEKIKELISLLKSEYSLQ